MTAHSSKAVRLGAGNKSAPVSQARKQFNTLIAKLETERKRLSSWHDALPALMAKAHNEYMPLTEQSEARQKELILMLDQFYSHKQIGKREREKLADLICSMALDILEDGDDEDLKRIYEKYSGEDIEEETRQVEAHMKIMLEQALGVRLDDDVDLSSPEAVAAVYAEMDERFNAEMKAREEHEAKKPKSAKAKAKEQHHLAEQLRLQQSVREIFRKLTSALHPDREQDPIERARKTALMQRVNVAYGNNDLLGLLELQLEIDQIDQSGLNNLDDAKIKQYNKILQGQVSELQQEIGALEMSLMYELDLDPQRRLTPQSVEKVLNSDLQRINKELSELAELLNKFQDITKLKAWLKGYRIPKPDPYYDDGWY